MDLVGEINRLAGVPVADRLGLAGACNAWAGTTGLEAVGALNVKAGLLPNGSALEMNGVLQRLGVGFLDQGGFTVGAGLGGVGSGEDGSGGLQNTLRLPGLSGNYMSTPDTGAISITGDIDIRVKVAYDVWLTPAGGKNQNTVSKWNAGTQRSYRLALGTDGFLFFSYSLDGTAQLTSNAPAAISFTNGQVGWIRVTRVSATGVIAFYTSIDGVTWTQLGGNVAGTSGSLFDSVSVLEVGSRDSGADPVNGNVYYAEVRSGIDGPVVAKFDSSTVAVRGERLPTTHTQPSRAEAIRFTNSANFLSQPDSAANSITGDIDLRIKCAADDWTNGLVTNQRLISKLDAQAIFAYDWYIDTVGIMNFVWYAAGTSQTKAASSGLVTADGATIWLRVTFAVATGQASFYTSADGVTWTPFGTPPSAYGATALLDTTSSLYIGNRYDGVRPFIGSIYSAEVRSGIDGPVVASFNAANVQPTAAKVPTAVDLWTINGAAWSWDVPVAEPSSGALRLPGVAGNYVSTPDAADISIAGDIDLRAKVSMDDWTPTTIQYFIAKYSASATQGSYGFRVITGGNLSAFVSADGLDANLKFASSSVPTGVADGSTKWVRVTVDIDNGSSGMDFKFYTGDDGIAWTQLGTTVTLAGNSIASIFDSTAPLELGALSAGGNFQLAGYIYRAEVRSGIGGAIVASFDAEQAPIMTNRLPATVVQSGRTWTINGALWEWVNQPSPTPWTVSGSQWWWGTSKTPQVQNVIELDSQYVQFDGATGNYASTPDSAALSITGDIDVRAKVAVDNWSTGVGNFLAKWTSVGTRSWFLSLSGSNSLFFAWSADGTASTGSKFSSALPFTNGQTGWVRVTLDVDNGSTQNETKFYTSLDGVTWTQLGSTQTGAGVTSIFDSTAVQEIGSRDGGTGANLAGKVYYAEIRNGIAGTVVGEFSAPQVRPTAVRSPSGWGDPIGNTWNVVGSAWSWGVVPGVVITTPDSAALSITGDLDLRAKVTLPEWLSFPLQSFLGNRGSNLGYQLRMAGTVPGRLEVLWGNGAANVSVTSSAAVPFTSGQTGWVRVTLDVDDGAGHYVVVFYTSPDGVTWTPLGTTTTGGTTTAVGDATSAMEIGHLFTGGQSLVGTIHYAEIRNGIAGTVVGIFNPNVMHLTGLDPSTNTATTPTTLASPTGETWTVSGSGWRWRATP